MEHQYSIAPIHPRFSLLRFRANRYAALKEILMLGLGCILKATARPHSPYRHPMMHSN